VLLLQAFYCHIYSVSHLQKTSDMSSSSKPKSPLPTVPKSSFPMDTLCLNASFLSLPKAVHYDEYEDPSYDTQFPQFSARTHHMPVTANNTSVRSVLLPCMFCVC